MKVKQLFKLCENAIKDGYGDCDIIICKPNDGAGDEFFPLDNHFNSVIMNDSSIYNYIEEYGMEEDNVIVLN